MEIFGPADLAQRFAPLVQGRAALLAVSGGPDSVALMLLASDWQRQCEAGAGVRLFVATVDHGLRPEASDEAKTVAAWAEALGLPHHSLAWQGEKPQTRLQERAREARYGLLFRHALEIGASHVVTAHHADDQAETILFRLLRGSGLSGLAGMPATTRRGDLVLFRPLLDCPKDALIDVCAKRGHPFFRDPSNENMVFARTRLRRLAPLLAAEGLDRDALLRLSRRAARADDALGACTERLRAQVQADRSASRFQAAIGGLAEAPAELFQRFIEAEIHAVGADKPLRLERLETLAMALRGALQRREIWHGSLAGLAFSLDRYAVLTIGRENLRRRGRRAATPQQKSALPEASEPACRDPVTSG